MSAGIYKLWCRSSSDIYIGQTRNFGCRKSLHFSSLRNGSHPVRAIQEIFDRLGCNEIVFEIMETVDDERKRIGRERELIQVMRPSLNNRQRPNPLMARLDQTLVPKRLVDGKTIKEIASEAGVTARRVYQVLGVEKQKPRMTDLERSRVEAILRTMSQRRAAEATGHSRSTISAIAKWAETNFSRSKNEVPNTAFDAA